jgi:predicted enzyme related to lactoylglutathione lyase
MNKVTHFEFPWDDKERAKSFYQKVFNWKPFEWEQFNYTSYQTGPVNEKMQPTEPGFINGGSSKRDPAMPYPMFYIDVPDIDLALSNITQNGGSVVRGKTPLGENGSMGFLAWFKDSEGNILGLSQSASSGK